MSPWRFQTTIIIDEKEVTEQKLSSLCEKTLKILFKGAKYKKLEGEGTVLAANGIGTLLRIKRLSKRIVSIQGVLTNAIDILKFCQALHIPANQLELKHVK